MHLLQADPDLGRFLSAEELPGARQLAVPVIKVSRDQDIGFDELLETHGAFGGLVLDGMVLRELQIGQHMGMRMIGPGEIVTINGTLPSMLTSHSTTRAAAGTHLALLGREVLIAIHRWPSLLRGLQLRWAQQEDRLATQLVICQLPRVDQRLLALMWLLAESWGRVTPAGTTLPLKLTHDALGALVGARRPTVTLALRELTDRGAIVRQNEGWLLLEAPPDAAPPAIGFRRPWMVEEPGTGWRERAGSEPPNQVYEDAHALLTQRLDDLRERHRANTILFGERLQALAKVRERCQESRRRLAQDRLSRRSRRSS